jgi:hypothetical protein
VHPEVEELRPKLKEILYDCAVDIRATKAALFLVDNGSKLFELVTEYGFRGAIRPTADRNDPIIDRCGRGRTPFFINGLTAEPRFSELMYNAASERLLAAPLYVRGALVGVVDMRDKAGKQPFDQADLPKAQKIAERIAALFANKNVFGLRYIELSNQEESTTITTAPLDQGTPPTISEKLLNLPQVMPQSPLPPVPPSAKAAAQPPPPAAPVKKPAVHVPRLATLVVDARTRAASVVVPPSPESIGEPELAAIRDALRSILMIPAAVTATFSAFGHMGGIQETAAKSTLTDEAATFLQSKFNVWLTKRGEAGGLLRNSVQTPFGTSAPPIAASQLQKVFTAPVVAGTLRSLYLTVAFAGVPDKTTHEMLAAGLTQMQVAIEHSMNRVALQSLRMRVAEKLLEPDLSAYPELRRHTDMVVARVEQFARALSLPPAEAENVKLVAMVHDCGMRLLEYDRLYLKKDISPEELSVLREHPFVGAAIVEPLLGAEIARAVLCHHERVDGRGYPHELHGDDIPLASRIVQLCDAWVSMTDSEGYQQRIESPENAIAIITRGAGSQFDASLAGRFVDLVRSSRA